MKLRFGHLEAVFSPPASERVQAHARRLLAVGNDAAAGFARLDWNGQQFDLVWPCGLRIEYRGRQAVTARAGVRWVRLDLGESNGILGPMLAGLVDGANALVAA